MKTNKKTKGFTLMELMVAIPMLAFVFLSMAYILASTGNFTSVEIAKFKTQTAANNILMLIKAKGFSNLDATLKSLNDPLTFSTAKTNTNSVTTTVTTKTLDKTKNTYIPNNSIVHPDGATNLTVTIVEKPAGDDANNVASSNKICVITVTAEDFHDISTVIKTVSF